MPYSKRYQIRFKNRQQDICRVEILEKDYSGSSTDLEGAANPFSIRWRSNEEKVIQEIQASDCTIEYYNNGLNPITSFYSEEDDKFRIDFYYEQILVSGAYVTVEKLMWTGFLVQDDCQEDFLEPPHLVILKGTDNLGLLKSITLDKGMLAVGVVTYLLGTNPIGIGTLFSAHIFSISGLTRDDSLPPITELTIGAVTYTIHFQQWFDDTTLFLYTFDSVAGFTAGTYSFTASGPIDITKKIRLLDIIHAALISTGLELPINIFSNIFENTTDDRTVDAANECFSQTYIDGNTYLKSDFTYDNLYNILQQILFRFNCSLKQSEGIWQIIRLGEARLYTDNNIPGTAYSFDLSTKTTVTLDPSASVLRNGEVIFINANQIRRVARPFKSILNTFNYRQPENLIRNLNLQELGSLINEYTELIGSGPDTLTVREYTVPYWYARNPDPDLPDIFIRVKTDTITGVEKERYLVLNGGVFGGPHYYSSEFYMNEKDRVNISFSFRTSDSQAGPSTLVFIFQTTDGVQTKIINWDNGTSIQGSWTTVGGAIYSYASTQNLNEWTTFSVESLGVPIDGYFKIGVNQADFAGTAHETQYKDFSLTYLPFINDSAQIIGQTHFTDQPENIKNISESEIFIDDSPKNSIAGALFTPTVDARGEHQTRTALWHRGTSPSETVMLGEIVNMENKLASYTPRTIIEGDFFGLRYTKDSINRFITPVNILQILNILDLNFIFISLEVNYMSCTFKATIWELYKTGDSEASFEHSYKFNYLYQHS